MTEPGRRDHQDRNGSARRPPPSCCDAGPVRVVFTDGDLRQVRRDGTEIVRRIYVADPGPRLEHAARRDQRPGDRRRRRQVRDPVHPPAHGRAAWTTSGTPRSTARRTAPSGTGCAARRCPPSRTPRSASACITRPTASPASRTAAAAGRAGQRHAAGRHRPADPPRRRHRPAAVRAGQRPGRDARVRAAWSASSSPATCGRWRTSGTGPTPRTSRRRRRPASGTTTRPRAGDAVRPAGRDPGIRLPARRRRTADAGPTAALTIAIGEADGPAFPPVGLRCADPGAGWSAAPARSLRAIGPAHLRADVHLASCGRAADARVAAADRRAASWAAASSSRCSCPAGDAATGAALGLAGERAGRGTAGRSPGSWRSATAEESSSAGDGRRGPARRWPRRATPACR